MSELTHKQYHCPVEFTLDIIGGKWKTLIIWHLRSGSKRYGELKKLLPDITQKMLTQKLKELEFCQLVRRQRYPGIPLKVEYSLTPQGESLHPVLDLMSQWGIVNFSKTEEKTH